MTKLPFQDGERFIETCEKAVQEGNADFISQNLPMLRKLIGQYQDRAYELAQLQQRARVIVDQHEPSAEERLRS